MYISAIVKGELTYYGYFPSKNEAFAFYQRLDNSRNGKYVTDGEMSQLILQGIKPITVFGKECEHGLQYSQCNLCNP